MTGTQHAGGHAVTAAVSNIAFLQPVQVGDTACCYTDLVRRGRTSITLGVEVWVLRQGRGERIKVTDAEFTFVAVGEDGRKRKLPTARRTVGKVEDGAKADKGGRAMAAKGGRAMAASSA